MATLESATIELTEVPGARRNQWLSAVAIAVLLVSGCGASALNPGDDGGGGDDQGAKACGDGICGAGENCTTCSVDCGLCTSCGDHTCQASETCSSCPEDCNVCPKCGDGYCNNGENCTTCAPDCGNCESCGNGKCEAPKEDCFTCSKDCGACMGCGDGKCQSPETCASCPHDCGVCAVCGNMKCEGPYETCVNCPMDCGACETVGCFQMLTCSLPCIDLQSMPPMPSVTCVADCVARGCPSAQFFFDQALNCFIKNIGNCRGGGGGGSTFGCLQMQCMSEVAACTAARCQ